MAPASRASISRRLRLVTTNTLTGAVGADITTSVNGIGREVQTVSLGGTAGGLVSFELNGQRRAYWDETQRITVPAGFPNDTKFQLNVFKTNLNMPALLLLPVQASLTAPRRPPSKETCRPHWMQTFGLNVFTAMNATANSIDITGGNANDNPSDGTAPNLNVPTNGGNFIIGSILRTADIPTFSAYFPVSETQTITFPANFTAQSTYQVSFMGYTSTVTNFNPATVDTQITFIDNFLQSITGISGNYTFPNYLPGSTQRAHDPIPSRPGGHRDRGWRAWPIGHCDRHCRAAATGDHDDATAGERAGKGIPDDHSVAHRQLRDAGFAERGRRDPGRPAHKRSRRVGQVDDQCGQPAADRAAGD